MKVTVFNVGRGSAVLVELPPRDGVPAPVGIIDCFSGIGREAPLLKRLAEIDLASKGQASIEFLVITHLHEDHFFGAAEVIKRFNKKIKKYYDPGIDPVAVITADFKWKDDHQNRKELLEIDSFKTKNRKRVYSLTSPDVTIYSDSSNQLTVTSVAPDGLMLNGVKKSLSHYFARFRKALDRDEGIPEPGRSYNLNRTSSAIQIRFRDLTVLLGGDVLNSTWKTVAATSGELQADVILLSHHGSSDAFPKQHWGRFQRRNGHSIVSGKGRGQPAEAVMKHLKGTTGAVWATNVPSTHRVDPSLAFVSLVHHGAIVTPTIREGDVVCDLSHGLEISGPRIF